MAERIFTSRITVKSADDNRRLQAYREAVEKSTSAYGRLVFRFDEMIDDLNELAEFVRQNVERLKNEGYSPDDIDDWFKGHFS